MEQYYAYRVKKWVNPTSSIVVPNPPPVGTNLQIEIQRKIQGGKAFETYILSSQVAAGNSNGISFWIGHKWIEALGTYRGYVCHYIQNEKLYIQLGNGHQALAYTNDGRPILYNQSLLGHTRDASQTAFHPIIYLLNYERARQEALCFLLIAPQLPLHRNIVPQIARLIYESHREEIKF